ncbi:MAG: hypothetical protein AB1529_02050 [Candidatus Micrarchaeota archaeon]
MTGQRQKPQDEQQVQPQIPTLRLQIPQRAGQQTANSVVQIPNGYEFILSGAKIRLTTEVTPTSQMLYLTIDLNSLSAPARSGSPRRDR